MALGKKIAELDWRDMVLGMSTSDEMSDGGFSPSTTQVQLTNSPGVAFMPALQADASTNVTGEIIASCEDGQAVSSVDRCFLDDEGHYYTWNGTAMTLARTDGANNYVQGKTDMVGFDGSVFATSDDTVVKWTVDSSFDASFVTGLQSNVPHPLLVYENNMYLGDKNVLKRFTDASDATPDSILTLPTNQTIVALSVDPGSGKMLISVTQALNISGTLNQVDRVLYYDGQSNKADKVVLVDEMITAFFPVGSYLYVGYGQNVGYWNGAGIEFLRKLSNITFNNERLLYKQHFTNNGTTMYCIDGDQILAHGPIYSSGPRVFYYALKNSAAANFTHVASIGSNKLGVAYATDKFATWDSASVATGSSHTLYTNVFDFDDEMWIRRIRIIWGTQVSNGTDPGSLNIYNEDGLVTVGSVSNFDLVNSSGAAMASKTIEVSAKLKQIQVALAISNLNPGVHRIIVYGEPANLN